VCVNVVESVVKKVSVVTVSIDVLTKVLNIVVVLWAETDVVVSVRKNSVDLPVVWKVVVVSDEEVSVVDVVVEVEVVEVEVEVTTVSVRVKTPVTATSKNSYPESLTGTPVTLTL
jgi:hypothetical protein